MAEVLKMRFLIRSRTAAEWTALNEVLLISTEGTGARELGMEEDTGKFKLGDGITAWNDLPYASGGAGGDRFAIAAGTANALTVSFDPVMVALADGDQFKIRAGAANTTTTPTLKIDALTARTITKQGGQPLLIGDIRGAGHELIVRYVDALPGFELLNPTIPLAVESLSAGTPNVSVDASNPKTPIISVASLALAGRVSTYAGLPSSGLSAGDAYLVDADGLVYVWSGTAWPASGGGFNMSGGSTKPNKVPKASDFTTLGASSFTASDRKGRLYISVPSASTNPRCLLKTLPATPYTIDLGFSSLIGYNPPSSDAHAISIALSDGTKITSWSYAIFGSGTNPRFSVDRWNSTSSYQSTVFTGSDVSLAPCIGSLPFFLRLTDDGTTRKFYFSYNGLDFKFLYSEAHTAFFTATKGGIEVYNMSSSGAAATVAVTHFQITPSILGDAA